MQLDRVVRLKAREALRTCWSTNRSARCTSAGHCARCLQRPLPYSNPSDLSMTSTTLQRHLLLRGTLTQATPRHVAVPHATTRIDDHGSVGGASSGRFNLQESAKS